MGKFTLRTFYEIEYREVWKQIWLKIIDTKIKNSLLKVCYVPATSATFLAFFSFFLLWPSTVLMRETRQAVHVIKQSILIRCLCWKYNKKCTQDTEKLTCLPECSLKAYLWYINMQFCGVNKQERMFTCKLHAKSL